VDGESAVSADEYPINFFFSQSRKKHRICHFHVCPLAHERAVVDDEKSLA
jgi:hypothetical protein